ncbi:uncharacterized protein LOC110392178 [Numida meleagris]|uniref:uncharacterized protein LOC110392178 n=1 Tax=Numida meleagris TaxID=8996 RepID=UPI000B3E2424|nr:uncharacterized protein LOC110392178 [Numida meleagris]
MCCLPSAGCRQRAVPAAEGWRGCDGAELRASPSLGEGSPAGLAAPLCASCLPQQPHGTLSSQPHAGVKQCRPPVPIPPVKAKPSTAPTAIDRAPAAAAATPGKSVTGVCEPGTACPMGIASQAQADAPRSFEKCLRLNPDVPVWASKQRILCTLNHSLKDVLNYGLFQPAFNGRAGKFLDEERLLREYPLNPDTPVPYLEFRYKRRVYTQTLLDDKQFAKLHTKANLKKFMEYVQMLNAEKVCRLLEKGLDPNFHDPDTGGEVGLSREGGDGRAGLGEKVSRGDSENLGSGCSWWA